MKKKFDFTAEMKEVQVTKSTPQNEYLEEEKRLLGINVKELAELNDNVYGLRTDLTALVDLLGKYKLSITQDTQDQAVKFGHYKIFCVNVKYRIQNRVLYFLFYIFTPKE